MKTRKMSTGDETAYKAKLEPNEEDTIRYTWPLKTTISLRQLTRWQ